MMIMRGERRVGIAKREREKNDDDNERRKKSEERKKMKEGRRCVRNKAKGCQFLLINEKPSSY